MPNTYEVVGTCDPDGTLRPYGSTAPKAEADAITAADVSYGDSDVDTALTELNSNIVTVDLEIPTTSPEANKIFVVQQPVNQAIAQNCPLGYEPYGMITGFSSGMASIFTVCKVFDENAWWIYCIAYGTGNITFKFKMAYKKILLN